MVTQQKSKPTPSRVPRRRTTSSLFDKSSKRSKIAMLLAAASLLTVGLVGATTLSEKDRQAQVVDNTKPSKPTMISYSPQHPPQQNTNMSLSKKDEHPEHLDFPNVPYGPHVPNNPPPPYYDDVSKNT